MNFPTSISFLFSRRRLKRPQDPVRDWFILLAVSVIVLVGVAAWNVWTFEKVAGGGTLGTPVPKALPVFNRSAIETVRAVFESRAAEEAKYRTGVYRFADPSQ